MIEFSLPQAAVVELEVLKDLVRPVPEETAEMVVILV